jgi:hypothetical protein
MINMCRGGERFHSTAADDLALETPAAACVLAAEEAEENQR